MLTLVKTGRNLLLMSFRSNGICSFVVYVSDDVAGSDSLVDVGLC